MVEASNVLDELLPLFQSECEERLNSISGSLASIEDVPDSSEKAELVEALLRELHSLKGGARAVNLGSVESVAHAFEQVLVRIQGDDLDWNGEVLDSCHQAVSALGDLVMIADAAGSDMAARTVALLDALDRAPVEVTPPPSPPQPVAPPPEQPVPSPEEQELLRKLLPIFRAEADERLESIADALRELRAGGQSPEAQHELFESVMRDAHSLKGGARTLNLGHVSMVCKEFEFAAAKLTRKELSPYPALYDLFERASDLVQGLLESPENLNEGAINLMVEELSTVEQRVPSEPVAPVPTAPVPGPRPAANRPAAATHTVRVATEKLDSVLRQSQEMLVTELMMQQRSSEVRDLGALVQEWQAEWSRVDTDVYRLQSWVEKHDEHTDPSGVYALAASATRFLEWSQKTVRSIEKQVRALGKKLFEDQQSFGVMVDTLVDDTKRALMLPLSTLFKGLPRMVREVARAEKKAIDLEVQGDDVEVDKRILDEMRDPLMHLLRNCVDHGIEAPTEREAAGKAKRGKIAIEVSQSSADQVELLVRDDGRGIDTERVRVAAVKNGILVEGQSRALARDEVLQLIFRSGVSTSERVSNISGRGLGMAICREGVERLGGRIVIESESGQGTSFRIALPLALATYRVLLMEVGRQVLAVPTANTERVVRLTKDMVTSEDGKDSISDRGDPIHLQRLDAFLGLESGRSGGGTCPVAAVLQSGKRRVAFAVTRVIAEQEVLFKDLGSYLVHVPNVSGATVLGTGTVVPILNVPEMIDAIHAKNVVVAAGEVEPVAVEPEPERPRSILVVEDSITSRMLLKEILESAGYVVSTAINGAEAVTALEADPFDIVVSDVEMPRMNGFELTEHIRTDPRLSELPVILVTGLERPEQRERGLAAGANEYIVKGSFEQSNLLDAIQRLCEKS